MNSSRWIIRLASLIAFLTAMGLIAAALLPYPTVRGWLDHYAGDGSAEPYTPALHLKLRWALTTGAALLAIGMTAAWWLQRFAASQLQSTWNRWLSDVAVLWRKLCAILLTEWGPLIVLTLLAALFRLPWLNMLMRSDEAYTYLNYASQPWFVLLSKYQDPNNHIFHNLLMAVVNRVLGNAPWQLRLPAFIAGVAVVPFTFLLASAVGGRYAGMIAGVIVCGSSAQIEYSTNARGYTLVTCFTVIGWLAALVWRRSENWGAATVLIIIGTLGLWTVPTMLTPLAMIWLWLLCTRFQIQPILQLALIVALTGLCTLLCYAPVLLVSNPVGLLAGAAQSQSLDRWVQLTSGLTATWNLLLRDWPIAAQILGAFVMARGLIASSPAVRELRLAVLSALAGMLALAALGSWTFPRAWIYLVPLTAVLIGTGCATPFVHLPRLNRPHVWVSVWAMFAGLTLFHAVRERSILTSSETGLFPAAERIMVDLQESIGPNDRLVSITPASSALVYYGERLGISPDHFLTPTRNNDVIVVVSQSYGKSLAEILSALQLTDFRAEDFHYLRSEFDADLYRYAAPKPPQEVPAPR